MKFLKLSFYTLFLALIALLFLRYHSQPTRIIPYPYQFTSPQEESDQFNETQILIVGDRMGLALSRYIPLLSERLSAQLKKPIKVNSWAKEHEGLHRTLRKLKSLKKLPPIILYHGGSEEFFEKKFYTEEAPLILENFSFIQDQNIATALHFFPAFSRFLFHKQKLIQLDEFTTVDQDLRHYDQLEFQKRSEVLFKLYEKELEEMISWIKEKGSRLVILSTPINLDIQPKRPCVTQNEQLVQQKLGLIQEALQKRQLKLAYDLLVRLKDKIQHHPLVYYYLGQAAQGLSRSAESIQYLQLAAAFDCQFWRGGKAFDQIQKKYAALYQTYYFDFSQFLNDQLGQNTLFLDEIYPQPLFYEQAVELLAQALKKSFGI